MRTVHVVVPAGVDDPGRPSGGNTYDRRVLTGLAETGWDVREYAVRGAWPWPDVASQQALALLVAGIPDEAVLLVDGLVASTVPDVLVPEAKRVRLVVLVHLPLGDLPSGHEVADARTRERAVLCASSAVVATSEWARGRLVDLYGLRRVDVTQPGVDAAELATGTRDGGELLCVAAVAPHKGHDVLLEALAGIGDLPWRLVCVGTLDRDPAFVARLRRLAEQSGIGDRVCFAGALTGEDLDRAYAAADLLVLASRGESYGMVVTEALARGLPVVATEVGGLPEALGRTSGGRQPGLLVPPDDPLGLGAVLGRWLTDADLRLDLRERACERRDDLTGWNRTTAGIAHVLAEVAAGERDR